MLLQVIKRGEGISKEGEIQEKKDRKHDRHIVASLTNSKNMIVIIIIACHGFFLTNLAMHPN